MTYVNVVSEKIEKVMTTHTDNTQLAYKNNKCLRNVFTKTKDSVPLLKRTNVIYKIPCLGNGTNSCDKSYVGQTKQYLGNRLNDHKRDLKREYNPSLPKTALVEHFHELDHYPDFKSVSTLGFQRNLSKRLTVEALHIQSHNTYNVKRDTDHMTSVFSNIIENATHTLTTKKRLHTSTALSPASTHKVKTMKLN